MSEGLKYDAGKDRYDLVPVECLRLIVKAITFGATKYAPNNWQRVKGGRERYYSALMRHLESSRAGDLFDDETGLPHLAHAGCCLIFLLWYDLQKIKKLQKSSVH